MADTDRNSTTEISITPESLMIELGVEKSAFYKWKDYLGEKFEKQNGKAFVTKDQADRFKELKMWRDQRGQLTGFLEAEKADSADGDRFGQLATTGDGDGAIDAPTENIYSYTEAQAVGDEDLLFYRAARMAAHRMAFPAELVGAMASQIAFEDLPPELQQQVTAASAAASPNFLDPAAIARSLLEKRRGQNQPAQENLANA
jgi:hypothetical protein